MSEMTLADKTAWLIEETWSGYIHYVHRDFDAAKWRAETKSLDEFPLEWVTSGTGATLVRRQATIPFITKNADEAMAFSTKEAADAWIAAQPKWLNHSDQHQAREHMWPELATARLALTKGSGDGVAVDWSSPLETNEISVQTNQPDPRPVELIGSSQGAVGYMVVRICGENSMSRMRNNPAGEYTAAPDTGFIRGFLCVQNRISPPPSGEGVPAGWQPIEKHDGSAAIVLCRYQDHPVRPAYWDGDAWITIGCVTEGGESPVEFRTMDSFAK